MKYPKEKNIQIIPCCVAVRINAVAFLTLSFCRRFLRWFCTVNLLRKSSSAILGVVIPEAMSFRIPFSRLVSFSGSPFRRGSIKLKPSFRPFRSDRRRVCYCLKVKVFSFLGCRLSIHHRLRCSQRLSSFWSDCFLQG